jgi:hypothetical protein
LYSHNIISVRRILRSSPVVVETPFNRVGCGRSASGSSVRPKNDSTKQGRQWLRRAARAQALTKSLKTRRQTTSPMAPGGGVKIFPRHANTCFNNFFLPFNGCSWQSGVASPMWNGHRRRIRGTEPLCGDWELPSPTVSGGVGPTVEVMQASGGCGRRFCNFCWT